MFHNVASDAEQSESLDNRERASMKAVISHHTIKRIAKATNTSLKY